MPRTSRARGGASERRCAATPLALEREPRGRSRIAGGVRILLPTIDRLRHRFAISRVCIVADRGMISAATLAGLEERDLEYILGARERTDRLVREVVLADERPFTPLLVERAHGGG